MKPAFIMYNYFLLMATGKSGARRRKKNNPKKTAFTFPHKFRLFATSTVAALFVGAIYSLTKVDLDNSPPAIQRSHPSSQQSIDNTVESELTFYSRLKDFEITVENNGNYSSQLKNHGNIAYIIQAGSFKTRQQAEQRLVELKLLGLAPTVDDNVNARGELWYRVLLGPFTSRSAMAGARNTIISNNIEAMVMQRKL